MLHNHLRNFTSHELVIYRCRYCMTVGSVIHETEELVVREYYKIHFLAVLGSCTSC